MPANKRWLLLLMGAFVLSAGVAQGAASLSAENGLVHAVRPVWKPAKQRHVSPSLIRRYRALTWGWETVMGRRRTSAPVRPSTSLVLRSWRRAARLAYARFVHPPHKGIWLCIHRYEGSWGDSGDPYWGGLQMNRGFMDGYAPHYLLRRGLADHWSPLEQMWVAERAYRSGRGFSPWPNTARMCGAG